MMPRGLRRSLLLCLIAGCAADGSDAPPDASAALETQSAITVDPVKTAARLAKAIDLVRPGSLMQTESSLGVPTFLWTRGGKTPAPASALAAGTTTAQPEVAVARAVLADYAPLYGLSDRDVAGATIDGVHDLGSGPVLVKLRAELGGIEIFGERLSVVLNRKLESVAITGYLTSTATPPARSGGLAFQLAPPAAAAAAVNLLARTQLAASLPVAAGAHDGYDYFTLPASAGVLLDEPIRVKPVYFHLPAGLEAAYYVEVFAQTGAPALGTLAADGSLLTTGEAYAYVVSAATGAMLFRKNLTADGAPTAPPVLPTPFTYRVWADPVTKIPSDTPAGNAVHPKVLALPDGAQATFAATSDVTLASFPYSMNDPWIAAGATETVGNNADAFLNLLAPDGLGNPTTTTPIDPAAADFRAQITGASQFLHAQIPDGNGGLAEGRQGAIQQVFYDVNFMHDWYYDDGFNEAAGNAQTDNFGRGGVANDSMKAQIQDLQGFSNANMTTGADGVRPRMRMYVFPSLANMLDIQAPAGIASKVRLGISMSGPAAFDISNNLVLATFSNSPAACTVTNAPALAGKIALFDFDNTDGTGCSFSTRIARLTANTTAVAMVMAYTSAPASAGVVANITGYLVTNTKPVATISWNSAVPIKAQLALPAAVTVRLYRAADRDGALDNQVVSHEWFHYASNRLIGNGAGLNTNLAGGMGEGWSDFNALLLTVRADDIATPSDTGYQGAYALATYATSGVPFDGSANQGYYFGIRRYPYSTDLTKNPLTFQHIANGVALPVGPPLAFGADGAANAEVHNTGEVWATMLWECYASLLRDTLGATPRLTFAQAQARMKRYLIAALKVTPQAPTFLEARDALLAVALANDPIDYVRFKIAFTRRGAGLHAVSPDRFSATNVGVVEDFGTGPELAFDHATLDDSLTSCDGDGAMDAGEYGRLTVVLRNTGTTTLTATTAAISTGSSDVWYPNGNTLAFAAMAPGATATATLRLAYLRTVVGIQQLDLQIAYTDPQLTGGPLTQLAGFRTNTDEIPATSALDTVEPVGSPWTPGFAPTFGNVAPWQRLEVTPLQHRWQVADAYVGSDQYLVSPVFTVDGSGAFNLQLDHSWSFEFDGGGNYDGGVIETSVNGGAFSDIGAPAYNGTILNYSGDVNPLKGRPGFVQNSAGTVHTSLTQAIAPGSTVQVRFRAASDASLGAPGWTLDNIAFTGVVETPFATLLANASSCTTVPVSADLAISITDGVTSVTAGGSVAYTITASNAGGDDIIGATVSDTFPSELSACSWTCTGSGGGTCLAAGAGDLAAQVTLPAGGAVSFLATCTVSVSTPSTSLSNTATVSLPGPVTDPTPGNNSATDTDTLIHLPALLTAGKTVTGSFVEGGTVSYAIVVSNGGAGAQLDNPGDELTDILPAGLALVSASATTGTALATLGTNTVTWNGAIAAGASTTITIVATVTATAGATVSNQATFVYDSDGNATNDTPGTTEAFLCD